MVINTRFTEKMKYEECSVTLRGDGRYYCRVITSFEIGDDGKKRNYRYKHIYGVDRNDVLMKRGEFIEEQIRLTTEAEITSELLTTKLHEWLYIHKLHTVKPNAFDRLEVTLKFQILPALQETGLTGIKLKDVTVFHVQQIMNRNLDKGYSYSTLLKVRNFLTAFFNFYEDDIPKNPMKKYVFFKKDNVIAKQRSLEADRQAAIEKIAQRKEELTENGYSKLFISEDEALLARLTLKSQTNQKDVHFFSDEEIERIKDAIENGYRISFTSRSGNEVNSALYHPKQGKFFLFMLNSGLRGGEAVALKYSDFDYDNGTVRIHSNAVNTKERNKDGSATGKRNRDIASTKTTTSDSLLHLSPYAIQLIQELQAEEAAGYDGYILHNGNRPIAEKALWQRLDKLLKGAGVQPCGLHSLRHTYATKLYEQTGDLKFVSQQLRHSDPSFTAKTYVHQSDKRTKEMLHSIQI